MISAASLLLLACISAGDYEVVTRDAVDVIELNTCYNDAGDVAFNQVIFWRWCRKPQSRERDYLVVDFMMVKSPKVGDENIFPSRGKYYYSAIDSYGRLLIIRSDRHHVTWCHKEYDPELRNRRVLPREDRVGFNR